MALHKVVNGERVELSQEKEAQIRAEWAANRLRREQKLEVERLEKEKQGALLASGKKKLMDMGLTDQEIEMMYRSRASNKSGV